MRFKRLRSLRRLDIYEHVAMPGVAGLSSKGSTSAISQRQVRYKHQEGVEPSLPPCGAKSGYGESNSDFYHGKVAGFLYIISA
jgi:hypothetical protein